MIYLQLFLSMAKIGAMSIGGGYVALPLIQEEIVNFRGWLTQASFSDLVTISEMTPGPIAINASTFVGLQVGEFLGAVIATLGCILPSSIIISILAHVYKKYRKLDTFSEIMCGLRPAVIGMIASAALSLVLFAIFNSGAPSLNISDINIYGIIIFIIAVLLMRVFKLSPIKTMLISGVLGVIAYAVI
ncbi:MAG TPA: chromate transporter [Christensenellaceae bacterium]|jgi:chromate transporter|nr:chromate transporter [Christensenellaceae bacterium]